MKDSFSISFDAFVRAFALSKDKRPSFLLGAGCSLSSGMPLASQCIWDWKKEIYLTQNKVIPLVFDVRQPSVQKKIQLWLDTQGSYPKYGDSSEYEFYVEKAYPLASSRKEYFTNLCRDKNPSIGYKMLVLLHRFGCLSSVWTTNFDSLTERAAILEGLTPINVNTDNPKAIFQNNAPQDLLYIALHGDYKYEKLKNTGKELDTQEKEFVKALSSYFINKDLIVIGYSGRDKSLMKSLNEAFSSEGGGRLFWCGYGKDASPEVLELIKNAQVRGKREAFYVNAPGFDEILITLMQHSFTNDCEKSEVIYRKIESANLPKTCRIPFSLNSNVSFSSRGELNLSWVKIPDCCYKVDIVKDCFKDKSLGQYLKGSDIVACKNGNSIYAFGNSDEILSRFKGKLSSSLITMPLVASEVYQTGFLKSLVLKAIIYGISKTAGLIPNYDKKIIRNIHPYYSNKAVYEAVKLNLVFHHEKQLFLLSYTPTLFYESDVSPEEKQKGVRAYTDPLRNKIYAAKLEYWKRLIFKSPSLTFCVPHTSSFFEFTIGRNHAAFLLQDIESQNYPIPQEKRDLYHGIRLKEPTLVFSSNGEYVQDQNPMRGLLHNMPFDYYANINSSSPINVCVICPISYTQTLHRFLCDLNNRISPRYKDYVQDFPGFGNVFKNTLDIPGYTDSSRWIQCRDNQANSKELAIHLCEFSERLTNKYPNSVVIIFIPTCWANLRHFEKSGEVFDLHNYVKAYAAQAGFATQFIEEKTLNDKMMNCEIRWWLSLALFVKAQRIPWVLSNLQEDTAYAGIGYSLTTDNNGKSKIIIGCSHLYNCHGLGLRYKLRKVDEPLWLDRKNPYLSERDAYNFGLNIIELYRNSMEKIPNRVVIHKRTPFLETEIKGITSALHGAGIANIDLISITEEYNIRGLALNSFGYDNYPIKRGTCIPISDYEALLWVHGVLPSVQQGKLYFAGGRAIPAPLKISRYYGTSDLCTIASEILGLTKMDWNSFNFYSKLPATIQSSNVVAQVGELISHLDGETFDYKYFM